MPCLFGRGRQAWSAGVVSGHGQRVWSACTSSGPQQARGGLVGGVLRLGGGLRWGRGGQANGRRLRETGGSKRDGEDH